nr:hypothetical protein [Lachnospiraceae bacterium]
KVPKFEESGIKDRRTYQDGVAMIEGMYKGTENGNPAIFGDYIFDKLPDTAVRSAVISREEGRLPYCKRRFLETLSKNLENGPVGMLNRGHFVLIRELRGDKLMVNDSLNSKPDDISEYGSTVSDLFALEGQQLELVWLQSTKSHEKEIATQFDLDYDAGTGTFALKNNAPKDPNAPAQANIEQVKNEQTILHKKGIEALSQLPDDVVFNSIYVPKKVNANGQLP